MPASKARASTSPAEVLEKLETACAPVTPLPPLEQLIQAVLAADADPADAQAALARLRDAYMGWNDVRAARVAELARRIDPLPDADVRARRLREMLHKLFELRGAMDLGFLAEMKPAEGRKVLQDLDPKMSRDVVGRVLFELCPGTTLPLSPEAMKLAKDEGLAEKSATKQRIQKILREELEPGQPARLVQCLEILAARDTPPPKKTAGGASSRKKSGGKAASKKTAKNVVSVTQTQSAKKSAAKKTSSPSKAGTKASKKGKSKKK